MICGKIADSRHEIRQSNYVLRYSFHINIVACHLPRAPSYGGVRTWVEGRVLARIEKLPAQNHNQILAITRKLIA